MLLPRLIPTLLVDANLHLVKTQLFKNRNYLGDPLNSAHIFSGFEADELIVLDIDASLDKKSISLKFVQALATFTTTPLCVGGGIVNLDQIKDILSLGVEKVAISSSLKKNIKLLEDASNTFGSSSITVIINCFKDKNGIYYGSFGYPEKYANQKIEDLALKCQSAGAGELIINNIDLEGTKKGYDIPLMQRLNEKLTIPLVALGGCGNLSHIKELISETPISGIGCGSFLVYAPNTHQVLLSYPDKSKWLSNKFRNHN